jgi:hypothetical protein
MEKNITGTARGKRAAMAEVAERLSLLSGPERIRPLLLLFVLFEQPTHFVMDLLPVLHAGKKDADTVTVILEVCGFTVKDEDDPAFLSEHMLSVFPPHIPLPLPFCRCGIFAVIAKDAHEKYLIWKDRLTVLLRIPAIVIDGLFSTTMSPRECSGRRAGLAISQNPTRPSVTFTTVINPERRLFKRQSTG